MVKEYILILMVKNMKVILKVEKGPDLEHFLLKMETHMKESFGME